MAIAYFKHTPVGKSTQAQPYTASAHARYIMRERAASVVRSHNMPRQYHAAQRFLNKQEDGIRKNGRVADKFIIAIPRELNPEQAERVLYRYGCRIGEGRAPFLFTFHWEENNPHAHFIFVDRDPETGERIAKTSAKNSTARLKQVWQDEVNAELEMAERSERISFDKEQVKIEAPEPSEEAVADEKLNKLIAESAPPVSQVEAEAAPAEEPTAEEMEEFYSTIERVQSAVEFKRELDDLKRVQAKLEDATNAIDTAGVQLEAARLGAAGAIERHSLKEQALYNAEERLARYTKSNGNLKGFDLFGWKSPARKAGEEAIGGVRSAQFAVDYARKDMEEAENAVGYWQTTIAQHEAAKAQAETEAMTITQAYGEDATLQSAKQTLTYNAARDLEGISVTKLMQMVQDGEISEGEYRDALELFGTAEAEEAIRAFDGYQRDEDEGQSL